MNKQPSDQTQLNQSGQTILGPQVNIAGDVILNQPEPSERRRLRNRAALLATVKAFWMDGFLKRSLYHEVYIKLGIEEDRDKVQQPWDIAILLPEGGQPNVQPGIKLQERYALDKGNQSLLILGAPGSGKTMTLLNLAREIIAVAEQDPTCPIPVIFNLSSWNAKEPTLATWLVHELNTKYNVPKQLAGSWVATDELLLLLDGLDEVAPEVREKCVAAINDFHQNQLASLVVCCRSAEYQALSTPLQFQVTIVLQLLSDGQICHYLTEIGLASTIGEHLKQDSELLDLVRTPLMLNLVLLAYSPNQYADLTTLNVDATRRRHILDKYIQSMFIRRSSQKYNLYNALDTIRWLSWLSKMMTSHQEAIFLIEQMQPSWLSTAQQVQWYYRLSRLLLGLSIGIGIGVILAVVTGSPFEVMLAAIAGLTSGFVASLRNTAQHGAPATSPPPQPVMHPPSPYWALALHLCGIALVSALVTSLLGWAVDWLLTLSLNGLNSGLSSGLITGGMMGAFLWRKEQEAYTSNEIQPVEKLDFSRTGAFKGVKNGLLWGALLGLLFAVIDGFTYAINISFSTGLLVGLIDTCIVSSIGGLIGGLLYGLQSEQIPTKIVPNQGIRLSLRNALLATLAGGICGGVLGSLVGYLLGTPAIGLLLAVTAAMVASLWHGYFTLIQHFTLRLLLWRQGHIPWNYARFLDNSVDRIFLRRVGGGYIFIHRILMEHFANLSDESVTRITGSLE